jgi:hypothetical protein
MKKILFAALFSLIAVTAAASQPIKTTLAFATGAFLCSNPVATAVFTNTTGAPMYVRQTVVWMGMDATAKGDFAAKVRRGSDGSIFAFTNWDHYAEPTNIHNMTMSYQPDYMLLADGDWLVLEYDCTKIGTTPANPHGNVVVYLWWTENP